MALFMRPYERSGISVLSALRSVSSRYLETAVDYADSSEVERSLIAEPVILLLSEISRLGLISQDELVALYREAEALPGGYEARRDHFVGRLSDELYRRMIAGLSGEEGSRPNGVVARTGGVLCADVAMVAWLGLGSIASYGAYGESFGRLAKSRLAKVRVDIAMRQRGRTVVPVASWDVETLGVDDLVAEIGFRIETMRAMRNRVLRRSRSVRRRPDETGYVTVRSRAIATAFGGVMRFDYVLDYVRRVFEGG